MYVDRSRLVNKSSQAESAVFRARGGVFYDLHTLAPTKGVGCMQKRLDLHIDLTRLLASSSPPIDPLLSPEFKKHFSSNPSPPFLL